MLTVILIVALASWSPTGTAEEAWPVCQPVHVPVTVAGVPGATVYGELCLPRGRHPNAVQLLVHGGTYTHAYWDWPVNRSRRYSYVARTLAAGYATFAVDRLGTGQSTRPHSSQVTLDNGAEALHDVISALREGDLGTSFDRVVWVGHSYGTLYAWVEASRHQDVDAFVLTGQLHSLKPSWLTAAMGNTYPAHLDPKFADSGLDSGYLTTRAGTRGQLFYYSPGVEPAVIALDERLKDTITATESSGLLPLVSFPPPSAETSPSRAIRVPTLLVVGAQDNIACGPPDGLDCTTANVTTQEAPYYTGSPRFQVLLAEQTGHDVQLHRSAPHTTTRILGWLEQLEFLRLQ